MPAIAFGSDTEPSWADISINIPIYGGAGFSTIDVAAVKWNDKVEVGERSAPDGSGRVATTGTYSAEASITFYRSSWRRFMRALALPAAPLGGKISRVKFDVLITHSPPGELDIYKVTLEKCRVLERGGDHKEGTDPDQVEVALFVSKIKDSGIQL